jgi:hypothetical protein
MRYETFRTFPHHQTPSPANFFFLAIDHEALPRGDGKTHENMFYLMHDHLRNLQFVLLLQSLA